jgi:hypothetical protein
LNEAIVLKRLKKYLDLEPKLKLPLQAMFFHTPKTIQHMLNLKEALGKKIDLILSSSTCKHFRSFQQGTKAILRITNKQQNDLTLV